MSVQSLESALKRKASQTGFLLKTNALAMYFRRRKFLSEEPGFTARPYSDGDFAGFERALRKDGVACLQGRYRDVATELARKYADPFLAGKVPEAASELVSHEYPAKFGRIFEAVLSFREPSLDRILFDGDLVSLMYNYYRRTPYYRNNPVLVSVRAKEAAGQPAGEFHTDGALRQVSYMLLLNDIGENDTHMEYLVGSHNVKFPTHRYRENLVDPGVIASFPVRKLVGKAGDLFIFDAGNGFHRANVVPGTVRTILHFNVNTGYELQAPAHDGTGGWVAFGRATTDSQAMFEKVVGRD
jgi:hypothetical protein